MPGLVRSQCLRLWLFEVLAFENVESKSVNYKNAIHGNEYVMKSRHRNLAIYFPSVLSFTLG